MPGTSSLFASTSAVYVFNENGSYIDWAPSMGEKTVTLSIDINNGNWEVNH